MRGKARQQYLIDINVSKAKHIERLVHEVMKDAEGSQSTKDGEF